VTTHLARPNPLLRGWVARNVLLGIPPHTMHHVDPAASAHVDRLGAAFCGQVLEVDAVWWSIPSRLAEEVLADDQPVWTVCASCTAALTRAAT
jgi:hypothetical protein